MIDLNSPTPLPEAVGQLSAKTPVGSVLRSAQWAEMPLALRQRAQFSAAVEDLRWLANVQDKLNKAISLQRERLANGNEAFVDRSSFIADMRKLADTFDLPQADPQLVGSLQDIRSSARLGMIFDIQTGQANGYAQWKMDQDPDVLDAFPAQELVRMANRRVPRRWRDRWIAEGGKIFGGRMIALKTDRIWRGISRFRTPWPPFDFRSGMGVEDVSQDEAETLGLLKPDEEVLPIIEDFNAELKASVRDLPPDFQDSVKNLFGDQVRIANGEAAWRGNLIGDLWEKVVVSKTAAQWEKVNLGQATPKAVELAAPHMDLMGFNLLLRSDDIKHSNEKHGEKEK
jgi:hypothetical protein